MVNLKKTEWFLGGYKQSGVTAELDTIEELVLTYRGVPLKRVELFSYLCLMFTGNPEMATMVDAKMVKAKQVWQVLWGKLISLGWRIRNIRIELF